MFYVYLIRSLRDGRLYTGYTADLKKRLHEHNSGVNVATKARRPFELIYYEAFKARRDAMARERNIKRYSQGYTNLKKRLAASLQARKWGEESPDTISNLESR